VKVTERQDPSSVGTALKTLSLRIRSTSADLVTMGEDADGAAETVSALRDTLLALTDQKVDIQLDEDTYKSTYEIMLEMSKVWENMTDLEQSSALELMFGKRQANIGASILSNMADAENALTTSLDSSGSALEEQAKYAESIQYSLDRLTATAQEFATLVVDSDVVKFFVDLADSTLELINNLGGLLPALTLVIGTIGLLKAVTKEIKVAQLEAAAATAVDSIATATNTVDKELNVVATEELAVANLSLATAVTAVSTATKKFITSSPLGFITIALTVITALTFAYNQLGISVEGQIKIFEDAKKEYEDSNSELKSLNEELQNTIDAIDELNNKDNITLVEESELNKLKKQREELELNLDVANKLNESLLKAQAVSASQAYSKQFEIGGQFSVSEETINLYRQENLGAYSENNTSSMIAAIEYYNQLLDTANKKKEELSAIPTSDITKSEITELQLAKENASKYSDTIDDLTSSIWNNVSGMQEQQSSMQEYYDLIKNTPYEELTKSQQDVYDNYTKISDVIRLIYSYLDPAKLKELDFAEIFNSDGIKNVREQLQDLAKSGELSPETFYSTLEYQSLLATLGLTAEEAYNMVLASLEDVEDETNNATSSLTALQLAIMNNETAINDFQSNIKSISEALSDITSLESNDILDLMQSFTDFSWEDYGVTGEKGVGNLKEALYDLSKQLLKTAIEDMPELKDALDDIWDSAINTAKSIKELQILLDEALGGYNDLSDTLTKVQKGQTLSLDEVRALISAYPELIGYITGSSGAYTIEEDALQKLIDTSAEAVNERISDEITAYEVMIEASKLRIEQYEKEIGVVSKYGAMLDNLVVEEAIQLEKDNIADIEQKIADLLDKQKQLFSDETVTDNTSEFSNAINWADQSIKLLEDDVSSFNDTLSRADGYSAQKKATDELITKQEELRDAYNKTSKMYSGSYNDYLNQIADINSTLANNVKRAIEQGGKFSIEDFIDENVASGETGIRETLYNLISGAIDDFNSSTENAQNAIQIGFDISDEESALREYYLDEIDNLYSKEKDLLDLKLNAGIISNTQYYEELRKLNDEYYKDIEERSNEYAQNELDVRSNLYEEEAQQFSDLMQSEIDSIQKQINETSAMIEALNKKKTDYETVASAITDAYQTQIDSLTELQKASDESYQTQIDAIQAVIDAKNKDNDETERQIALEQARYNLAKARNQQIDYVFKNGAFGYQANIEDIKNAQSEVNDLLAEQEIADLESIISKLEEAQEAASNSFQEEIDNLTELQTAFSDMLNEYEKFAAQELAVQFFGENWEEDLINGTLDLSAFSQEYFDLQAEIADNEAILTSLEENQTKVQEYADTWNESSESITSSIQDINANLTDSIATEQTVYDTKMRNLTNFVNGYNALLGSLNTATITTDVSTGLTSSNTEIPKYHDGGFVGDMSDSSNKQLLEDFTFEPLKYDEILGKLRKKEFVLTEEHQSNLLNNIGNSIKAGEYTTNDIIENNSSAKSVNITVQSINVTEAGDADAVVKAIANDLASITSQKINSDN